MASWDIDWSSDDGASSWGWRQEDAERCLSRKALKRSFVACCFYFFLNYLILHFIPKSKFQVAFLFFLLNDADRFCFSHLPCWQLLGHSRPPRRAELFPFKKKKEHVSSRMADLFKHLFTVFTWSLWPSQASLDQSMLCEDERSKFKAAHECKTNPEYPKFRTLHISSSPPQKGCSCTVPMHIRLLLIDNYLLR